MRTRNYPRLYDSNILDANKIRRPIFKQHGYNLLKIVVEFIECFALGMDTRKTRNTTNKQSRFGTAFDYRRVNFHH